MRQDVTELKELTDKFAGTVDDAKAIFKKIIDILDRSLPPDNPDDEPRWS